MTNYATMLTDGASQRTLNRVEVDVEKLRRLREDRVLSQRELARMAGLAQGTVWRLENGFPEARPSTIRKLAETLGIEPRELVRSKG
jgi:transcriptional regulator with XRE-family HTH domain